ncbi:MAG: nucleotidyltransferase family protein [bacterium]|nr:nucleotidyltransferase family protein [bacterium]MDT8396368.1 nucleotidyltransferase family protein [bacterium]
MVEKTSNNPGSIAVDRKSLNEFCRRNGIRKLSFFGSVLRENFGPDSDVDVLVQFEPGKVLGFDILDIEKDLSQLLGGRKVDLVNEKYLNHRLRPVILKEARVQYAQR